jgi:hypothetical protein
MATQPRKIHLVPRTQLLAVCSADPRGGGEVLSVQTRAEFNALARDSRCGRCDAIVNGRQQRPHGRR